MKLTIYKGKRATNYQCVLCKDIIAHFARNEIVVIQTPETIMIREATMEDLKTYTLNKTTTAFGFTSKYRDDLIGVWSMEKQGDLFILNEKIANK